MTTDSDVFYGFVFDGQDYPAERVEQAARMVQRHLSTGELRQVNDALLARLAAATEARQGMPKKELLADPAIRPLVHTLALANHAWITTVIARYRKTCPQLRGSTTEGLYSTALTGQGTVGGVLNAILSYDFRRYGVDAFSPYLARSVHNALQPTPKQERVYRRVETRTQSLDQRDQDGAGRGWVDRTALRPEAGAINQELLEVVRSVLPRLPTQQQRATAAWMIDRILATGELPLPREAAAFQRPAVSRERGRQLLEQTVDSIRRQIEADYPQLAAQGLNGWEQFKQAFTRPRLPRSVTRDRRGRAGPAA